MITAKLNVLKIEKKRLFKGEKGTYLDITLIPTPNDQYGNDYMVVQAVSKEERLAGKRGNVLGNAKIRGQTPQVSQAPAPASSGTAKTENLDEDTIPF